MPLYQSAAQREGNRVGQIIWSSALRRVGILDGPVSRKNSILSLYAAERNCPGTRQNIKMYTTPDLRGELRQGI